MPILTEQELQDIVNKETEAKAKLEEKDYELHKLNNQKRDAESKKKTFERSTVILGIIIILLLLAIVLKPSFLNFENGLTLEEGEAIVTESTIQTYEDRIIELESQLQSSDYTNPLDLQEFYAVQLGAFKQFNTRLTSDSYRVVHNADYNDFNLFTLGVFETEEEAETLRDVITKLNFEDAFVGLYKDGKRVKSSY